jgi:hypothetical protein
MGIVLAPVAVIGFEDAARPERRRLEFDDTQPRGTPAWPGATREGHRAAT